MCTSNTGTSTCSSSCPSSPSSPSSLSSPSPQPPSLSSSIKNRNSNKQSNSMTRSVKTTSDKLVDCSKDSNAKINAGCTTTTTTTTKNSNKYDKSDNSKGHINTVKRGINNNKNKNNKAQRRISVIYMTLAMAVHFAGHEFTRSPTMSMFNSKEMGFESSATLPLAVGFVSPFSMVLLWLFNRTLNRWGPRYALIQSTFMVSSFLFIIGLTLQYITSGSSHRLRQNNVESDVDADANGKHTISKYLLFAAFVYQSANVQFLYTQHWSFIGSVLSPEEVATSGSLIAGIGSITSTFAAAYVSKLVEKIGLIGSQCTAALIIGSSAIFANRAYQIASKYDFEPKHDVQHDSNASAISSSGDNDDDDNNNNNNNNLTDKRSDIKKNDSYNDDNYNNSGSNKEHKVDHRHGGDAAKKIRDKQNIIKGSSGNSNIIKTTKRLFRRVPILGAMFCEVLIAQCLSSLLNFQFVTEVKNTITNDEERAGFTGNCYAWVNGVSGALQFFILPFMVKRIGARWLWLIMPIIMLTFTSLQFYRQNPSLTLVGLTFLTMKTIEYSLRGQASEMVWVMLDYESRFIGKELINLFANRLGKSSTAIFLFLLTVQIEKDGNHLSRFAVNASVVLAFLWFLCTTKVAALIPSKKIAA